MINHEATSVLTMRTFSSYTLIHYLGLHFFLYLSIVTLTDCVYYKINVVMDLSTISSLMKPQ